MRVDRRSEEAREYRRLYKLAAWCHPTKGARAQKLQSDPLCERCQAEGRVNTADVVNHRTPHKGDMALFLDWNNLESTCKEHHDSTIRSEEMRGYSPRIGEDGWPQDDRHPLYVGRVRKWGYSIPSGVQPSGIPVVLVCGPPASGKSTYVQERAIKPDKVIDFDECLERVGGQPWDRRPDIVRKAFSYRAAMIRELSSRRAGTAWLIVGAPTRAERAEWREALGQAGHVILDTPADECIRRIKADPRRAHAADGLIEVVQRWWKRYEPDLG